MLTKGDDKEEWDVIIKPKEYNQELMEFGDDEENEDSINERIELFLSQIVSIYISFL